MFKKITLLLSALFVTASMANSITVKLKPSKPVVGEEFQLIFELVYTSNSTPDYPRFDTVGIEVVDRSRLGVRTSASMINGRIVSERAVTYGYTMIAERAGTARIRKIEADIDGKVVKESSKSFQILRSRPKPKPVFLQAESSSDSVYVGEAFDIKYNFYHLNYIRTGNVGHLKNPTFKNLLHRIKHLQMREPQINVNIDGQLYTKELQFYARAFAEKPGKAALGPMKVEVKTQKDRYSGVIKKTLVSKRLNVEVKDLPAGAPPHFTGLVGKHKFTLTPARKKFLVNEPIEIRLEISGTGALEQFEAPVLYDSPHLESFDTQSEFAEGDLVHARRTFNYVYLARSPVDIPDRKISLSYFDPDSEQYVTAEIEVPGFIVAGAAPTTPTGTQAEEDRPKEKAPAPVDIEKKLAGVIAPDFTRSELPFNWIVLINIIIGLMIVVILLSMLVSRPKTYKVPLEVTSLLTTMKRDRIEYSRLHKFLLYLNANQPLEGGSLNEFIDQSKLSEPAQAYFKNLLQVTEKMNYKSDENHKPEFSQKHFKEAVSLIAKVDF